VFSLVAGGVLEVPELGPSGGQTQGFALGHLDQCKALAGRDQGEAVGFSDDFKGTPEAGAGDRVEATADEQPIAELGRALVVNLGAGEHREFGRLGHAAQVKAHEGGEAGAAGFDHAQIGEVMDDATAIGIKKHHFLAGFNLGWGAGHGLSMPHE